MNGNGGFLAVHGFGGGNDIVTGVNGVDPNDAGQWFVHSVRFDGDTVIHAVNDTVIGTTTGKDYATTLSRLAIGEAFGGRRNGEPMDVAALLIQDGALTDAEHAQTLAYLTQTYIGAAGGGRQRRAGHHHGGRVRRRRGGHGPGVHRRREGR